MKLGDEYSASLDYLQQVIKVGSESMLVLNKMVMTMRDFAHALPQQAPWQIEDHRKLNTFARDMVPLIEAYLELSKEWQVLSLLDVVELDRWGRDES